MAAKRPGALTAAGIMSIIYGSLGCLCGLLGVLGLILQSANGGAGFGGGPEQKQIQEQIEREIPAYNLVNTVNTFSGLLEAIVILVVGIGLLNIKSWARLLGFIFLALAIVRLVALVIYQFVFVMPTTSRLFDRLIPGAPAGGPDQKALQVIMTITLVVTGIVYLAIIIYLVIIMLLLSKRTVGNALRDGGRREEMDWDKDRYGDEDRARPRNRRDDDYDDGWDARRPADSPPDDRFR